MNRNHTAQIENHPTITISVDERDGQVCATARLWRGDEESVGTGQSRLSLVGHTRLGRELAIARALADLSRRMMAATATDIESLTAAAPTAS